MRQLPVLIVLGSLLVGCGGGSTAVSGGSGRRIDLGLLSAESSGAVGQPVIMGGSGTVITGLAGTAFTNVSVRLPVPDALNAEEILSQTSLYFTQNSEVMALDYGSAKVSKISTGASGIQTTQPWVSASGQSIFASLIDPKTNRTQIFRIPYNGSSQVQLTTGSYDKDSPSLTTAGDRILFVKASSGPGEYRIHWVPVGGGAVTYIPGGDSPESLPKQSPITGRIGYLRWDSTTSANYLWSMKLDGTDRRQEVYIPINSYAWLPDSDGVLADYSGNGAHYIVRLELNGYGYQASPGFSSPVRVGTISPTGTHYTFTHLTSTPEIRVSPISLQSQGEVVYSGFGISTASWGPYVQSRTFIGTNGPLGASCGGFLFSQKGQRVPSVVAFDATTRSGLAITPQANPVPGQPNVVAVVDSVDALTSLSYANGMLGAKVTVLSPSKPAAGAIVSFDAQTGIVSGVIPFGKPAFANRSVSKEFQGGRLVFRGSFLGVWDSEGRNVAEQGAEEVAIDATTGKLLSQR